MSDPLLKYAISPYMTFHSQNGSAIRRMDLIARDMVKQYGDEKVFNFSLGNPRVHPPKEYDKIMIDTINDHQTLLYPHGYANNVGDDDAREAMAELFSKIQNIKIPLQYICLVAGCAGAINIFLRTVLQFNDEVIIFSPYFLEYPFYIENYGGKTVPCITKFKEGWQINKERFLQVLRQTTRVVIINSPQNPTGIIYSDETIKMISEECLKMSQKSGRPIWIISDDVYTRVLRPGQKCHQIFNHYKYSVIAYSLSKDLSLPGERIGALILNPLVEEGEKIIKAVSMANEFMSVYPPNRLHMRAIPKLLKYTSDFSQYDESQKIIEETFKELQIKYIPPQGAFYIFPKIPDGIDEEQFCEKMVKNFIVVVPGSAFDKAGFYRMSFCFPADYTKKAMEQFKISYKKVISEMSGKNFEEYVKDH